MDYDFNGKRVFLSGPMSDIADWNRVAFSKAEERCRELGAEYVYNPAKDAPDGGEPIATHEQYMTITLHELTRWVDDTGTSVVNSRPFYDVVVMLDGWWASLGACRECNVAEFIGVQIVFAAEVL